MTNLHETHRKTPPSPSQLPLSTFHLTIVLIVAVAAVSVVAASFRMTERAIDRAVSQREAAGRFVANELSVLRTMAVTSETSVAARLYLGIEECFRENVGMPFDSEDLSAARRTVASCAEKELGRLFSQGGPAMAEDGRRILTTIGVLK